MPSSSRFGRYEVEEEVARGGMGVIYRVRDPKMRRFLAVKVLLSADEGGDSGSRHSKQSARFVDEAQLTGQLDHPGIIPVYDMDRDEDGRLFFTMRLIKGRTLEEIFELVSAAKEGWSVTRALGVLQKVCEAMGFAHERGVIHRDLKPANVMIGRFGETYVMDWGLRLWEVESGAILAETHIGSRIDYHPDGRWIVGSSFADGGITLWDTYDLVVVATGALPGGTNAVRCSPDGQSIAVAGRDHHIRILDLELETRLDLDASGEALDDDKLSSSRAGPGVYALDFSPDGSQLVSGSGDGFVRIWDAETGERLRFLRGHRSIVHAVRWHPRFPRRSRRNAVGASRARGRPQPCSYRLSKLYDGDMLLNLLLASVVDPSRPDLAATVARRFQSTDDREWKDCLRCLVNHRIETPVWSSLLELGLRDSVPPFVAKTLHRAHLTSVIRTTAQMRNLSRILTSLGEHEIEPVLLKGAALLNSLYPNIGARPCGDIDLLVESDAMPTVEKVMVELGYRHHGETGDAKSYVDRQGINLDIHHRFRLFEDIAGYDLLGVLKPQFASVPTISVFEPNALLVHLVFHLRGHRPDMGYFLAWILDIGLLLNRCRIHLDVERIWALMPDRETVALLSRIVRFFALETGTVLLEAMPWERNGHLPLTSREILRSRRRAIWNLKRPLSSLRLLTRRLAAAPACTLPELRISDLVCWPGDIARERRSVASIFPNPTGRS